MRNFWSFVIATKCRLSSSSNLAFVGPKKEDSGSFLDQKLNILMGLTEVQEKRFGALIIVNGIRFYSPIYNWSSDG